MSTELQTKLRRNIFEYNWLRPESALIIARDLDVILSTSFRLTGKCLDFGGGDGSFVSCLLGARTNLKYDRFAFVNLNDKGGNIYNASSHLVEDWLEQEALSKPESLTNFDLNQNLLNVSKNFQIYSRE